MTQLRASMGMVHLNLPADDETLRSAGEVALAHGQLELMLRMTIKTLSGMSVRDSLKATERDKNWELREQIKKLFKSKTKDQTSWLRLKAILNECERLSEKRNRLLHNAWAYTPDGSIVAKGDDHAWGPAPTSADLHTLASEISRQVEQLNQERLHGFIRDVVAAEVQTNGS